MQLEERLDVDWLETEEWTRAETERDKRNKGNKDEHEQAGGAFNIECFYLFKRLRVRVIRLYLMAVVATGDLRLLWWVRLRYCHRRDLDIVN